MWFFVEKHKESNSWHRHILMEDAPTDKWKHPTTRMSNFLMEDPEVYFASTIGTGITTQQKMEFLNKVFRVLPFIPNGKSGLDIRPIHNLEKLTAYCSKQFELERPSYEILDPSSSDIDPTELIHFKQDGIYWKPRYEAVSSRPRKRLPNEDKDLFWQSSNLHNFIQDELYKCRYKLDKIKEADLEAMMLAKASASPLGSMNWI